MYICTYICVCIYIYIYTYVRLSTASIPRAALLIHSFAKANQTPMPNLHRNHNYHNHICHRCFFSPQIISPFKKWQVISNPHFDPHFVGQRGQRGPFFAAGDASGVASGLRGPINRGWFLCPNVSHHPTIGDISSPTDIWR